MLNATVDELVEVSIKVTGQEDIKAPAKVQGLTNGTIGTNTIELVWIKNEEPDLSGYSLFRDQKRITTVKDPKFQDQFLDSNKTYRYEVAAADKHCNEGPKSSPVFIKTIEGGRILNTTAEEVNLTCQNVRYSKKFNVSGPFLESINLGPEDNVIYITFKDKAGNKVKYKNYTLYDTTPPRIISTNLAHLTPSQQRTVTVKGNVSENATIHIYINDELEETTYTNDDGTFEQEIELKRDLIKEGDHDTPGEGGQIFAYSDEYLNNVRIEAVDRAGLNASQEKEIIYAICGSGVDWDIQIFGQSPSMLTPRLMLDGAAQIAFSVNFSWRDSNTNSTITSVSLRPQPMSPEMASHYDYEKVQVPGLLGNQLFNRKMKMAYVPIKIKGGEATWNITAEENTTFEKEEKISNHRKNSGDCLIDDFGCVRIPLQLVVNYEIYELETRPDGSVRRKAVYNETFTQKQCVDVEVSIDKRVNPNYIPKAFLRGAIDALTSMIDIIDRVLTPLKTVQKYVFYGCAISFLLQFVVQFSEKMACQFSAEAGKLMGKGFKVTIAETGQCNDTYTDQNQEEQLQVCQNCEASIKTRKSMQKLMKWVCDRIFCPSAPTFQKYIRDKKNSDARKPVDFFKLSASKGLTADTRSSCVEVSTGYNSIKDQYNRYKQKNDSEMCTDLHESDKKCCAYEYMDEWDSACVVMNELKESTCLAAQNTDNVEDLSNKTGTTCSRLWNSVAGFCDPEGKPIPELVNTHYKYHAFRSNRDLQKSAKEDKGVRYVVHELKGDATAVIGLLVHDNKGLESVTGHKVIEIESDAGGKIKGAGDFGTIDLKPSTRTGGVCLRGVTFGPNSDPRVYYRIMPDPEDENKWYVHRGFIVKRVDLSTIDMGTGGNLPGKLGARPDEGTSPNADSNINTQAVFRPDLGGTDLTPKFKEYIDNDSRKAFDEIDDVPPWFANDLKNCAAPDPETIKTARKEQGVKGKEPPKRILGPSKGSTWQDDRNVIDVFKRILEKIGATDQDYIVDPTSGLLRSIQCVCLPALTSYLAFWRTVAIAVRNCFQTILLTGDGDTGVCRAVITVYVCDLIWDLLKCFMRKYGQSKGAHYERDGGFGNIFGALSSSTSSTVSSINGRYGKSAVFRQIFSERKLVHAICLWAFTGTWDLDIGSLLEQNISIPIKSQPVVYPCTRRFVAFNPMSSPPGLTTWTYHVGAGLVAGADLRYRLYLQCSDQMHCDYGSGWALSEGGSIGSPELKPEEGVQSYGTGQCDCGVRRAGNTGPITLDITPGRGSLRANEMLYEEGNIYKTVQAGPKNSWVRYDKAILEWTYVNNEGERVVDKKECKIREEGEDPPIFCKFDVGMLAYRCALDMGTYNYIRWITRPYATRDVFEMGDQLKIAFEVQQKIPTTTECYQANCEHTKYLFMKVKNQKKREISGGLVVEPFNGEANVGRTIERVAISKIERSMFEKSVTKTGECDDHYNDLGPVSCRGSISETIKVTKESSSKYTCEKGKYYSTRPTEKERFEKITGCKCNAQGNVVSCADRIQITVKEGTPDGAFAIIEHKKPTSSAEAEDCESAPVPWTVEVGFYDSVEQDGVWKQNPGQISVDPTGETVMETFEVQVSCKKTGSSEEVDKSKCPSPRPPKFEQLTAGCICKDGKTQIDCGTDTTGAYCVDKECVGALSEDDKAKAIGNFIRENTEVNGEAFGPGIEVKEGEEITVEFNPPSRDGIKSVMITIEGGDPATIKGDSDSAFSHSKKTEKKEGEETTVTVGIEVEGMLPQTSNLGISVVAAEVAAAEEAEKCETADEPVVKGECKVDCEEKDEIPKINLVAECPDGQKCCKL